MRLARSGLVIPPPRLSPPPETGVDYTTTANVCPDKLDPWRSPAYQYFGAKWTGDAAPADETRGAIASSLQRIVKGDPRTAVSESWLQWN
ncbi:MAG: hypothetical protein ACRCYU_04870 [Nocardioides sp.]